MSSTHQPIPQTDPDSARSSPSRSPSPSQSPSSTVVDINSDSENATPATTHTSVQIMVNTLDSIVDINPKHNHLITKVLCIFTIIGIFTGLSGVLRIATCPDTVHDAWGTSALLIHFLPPLTNSYFLSGLISLFTLFHIGWRLELQRSTIWFIYTTILMMIITQSISVLIMDGLNQGWWAPCVHTGIWTWLYALIVIETFVTSDLTRRFFLIQYDIRTKYHSLLLFIFLLPFTGFHISYVIGLVVGGIYSLLPFLHISPSLIHSIETHSFIQHLFTRPDIISYERAVTSPPYHPHHGGQPQPPAINATQSRTPSTRATPAIQSPAQQRRHDMNDVDAEMDDDMATAANLLSHAEPYPETHHPHHITASHHHDEYGLSSSSRETYDKLINMGYESNMILRAFDHVGNHDIHTIIDWLSQH